MIYRWGNGIFNAKVRDGCQTLTCPPLQEEPWERGPEFLQGKLRVVVVVGVSGKERYVATQSIIFCLFLKKKERSSAFSSLYVSVIAQEQHPYPITFKAGVIRDLLMYLSIVSVIQYVVLGFRSLRLDLFLVTGSLGKCPSCTWTNARVLDACNCKKNCQSSSNNLVENDSHAFAATFYAWLNDREVEKERRRSLE